MVTLIPQPSLISIGLLDQFSPKRMLNTVRQQLRRVSCGAWVIGAVDGTFEQATQCWQPHIHLIAPASASEAFERIRHHYPQTETGSSGMVVKEVYDRPGAFSYVFKGYWPERRHYKNRRGRLEPVKRRLAKDRGTEWMRWRSSIPLSSLLFLYGVRRHGLTLTAHRTDDNTQHRSLLRTVRKSSRQ